MKYLVAIAMTAFLTVGAKAEAPTLGSCWVAVTIAQQHNNIWQSDIPMEDCLKVVGQEIDKWKDAAKCEDKFESDGKCYDSLGDIPGRTRQQQRRR